MVSASTDSRTGRNHDKGFSGKCPITLMWFLCLTLMVLMQYLPEAKPSVVHAQSSSSIGDVFRMVNLALEAVQNAEREQNAESGHTAGSGDDQAKIILRVKEVVEGVLGSSGLSTPTISSTINLIKELHENKCDAMGQCSSVWQYIDSHIHSTVRNAFSNQFKITSRSISERRESTMKRFKARLEWVEERGRTQTELKGVIDEVYDFLANIDPEDRFNFYRYRSIYHFDYSLATMYFADLIHKKMVLEMMMGLCQKLNEESGDFKYRTSTYAAQLQAYQRKWRKFASEEGPSAMKELFWKSYNCQIKDRGDWSNHHYYFECKDVFGNVWEQYWNDGHFSSGGASHIWGTGTYFDESARSRDPNEIQKTITDWMLTNFYQKIMLFAGQGPHEIPGNALPPSTFPGSCKSPCRFNGESYRWCVIGINGHHGGGWKRC